MKINFVLSLSYTGHNKYLFVNQIKIHQFKAKCSELLVYPLFLGIISKKFPFANMKDD